jgi:hypothetical protein
MNSCLNVMRSLCHTFRAAIATANSLWMAVLACFMSYTQPALANSGSIKAFSLQETVADQSLSGPMANMGNCLDPGRTPWATDRGTPAENIEIVAVNFLLWSKTARRD